MQKSVRQSSDWNLRSRISSLLQKDKGYDVEFLVGTSPGEQSYLCHKVILAAGSEVFETMFYGGFEQECPVRVPDVTPRAFALTLQYLYSDTVTLQDECDAFETAYSARKYMVPSLLGECERFLLDRLALTPKNVLATHEASSLLGMRRLQDRCLRYVSRNASEVFLSGSYARASRDAFEEVLSLEFMDIASEREIAEALWLWGEQRCLEDGVRRSVQNVRRYTREFLKHVRFFAMDMEELMKTLESCQLLDTSDELALLWNLAMPRSKREMKVPSGICTKSKTRCISNSSRVQMPGQYLYDGNMTSFLIDKCRMRADVTVTTSDSVTVIGAVIAFKPIPCYSSKDRFLEVKLMVENSTAQFRSAAKCRFETKDEEEGEEFTRKNVTDEKSSTKKEGNEDFANKGGKREEPTNKAGEKNDSTKKNGKSVEFIPKKNGEVERLLLLDDYVVIEKGDTGSLIATVTGEGVRLMRCTEDAATCVLANAFELRLTFDAENTKQFMPIKELMIV